MSRARGVRGARKMRAFAKDRVAGVASEEEWEACMARAGGALLVAEFSASWSQPCKAMAPYLTALSQQPQYAGVHFARIDLEACAALGAQKAVLSAPTYHFYRAGELLDSFSGAIPQRLVELLEKHKGETRAPAPKWRLFALLGALAAGAAWALSAAKPAPQPLPAAAAAPPAAGEAAAVEGSSPPPPPPLEEERAEERAPAAPAKKAASAPSKGARRA